MQVNTIFSALAGAERVFTVMDAPAEEADMPDAVEMDDVKGEVTMEHVTFGYNPDKTILKDINLYAHAGQKVAFVGSTGAGKTTITNLLNRFTTFRRDRSSSTEEILRNTKEAVFAPI